MKTAVWFDRTDWPADDPRWCDEPDRVEWRDEKTGLVCLARRGPSGAWCGYVAVSPGHPWHGLSYGECPDGCGEDWCGHTPENRCEVHGGLTFVGPCMEDDPIQGVCHIPEPGEPDDVWWFGFDCHHSRDYAPAYEARCRSIPGMPERPNLISKDVYRSLDYAKESIARLALALATK